MSMPSISSTPSSVSGLLAVHGRHGKTSSPPASAISTDTSAAAAEPLASAIVVALTHLGLLPGANATGSDSTATTSNASFAPLPLQQRSTLPIQQYRNTASTSSGLAQALSASTRSDAGGASTLPVVFQSLWTSLGSTPGMTADSSGSAIPSLPSFLNTLARNLGESGITGLRGLFVDTVA